MLLCEKNAIQKRYIGDIRAPPSLFITSPATLEEHQIITKVKPRVVRENVPITSGSQIPKKRLSHVAQHAIATCSVNKEPHGVYPQQSTQVSIRIPQQQKIEKVGFFSRLFQ